MACPPQFGLNLACLDHTCPSPPFFTPPPTHTCICVEIGNVWRKTGENGRGKNHVSKRLETENFSFWKNASLCNNPLLIALSIASIQGSNLDYRICSSLDDSYWGVCLSFMLGYKPHISWDPKYLNISLYDRKSLLMSQKNGKASFPCLNVSVAIRHARSTQTAEGTRHVRLTHVLTRAVTQCHLRQWSC